ncbi:MAG: sulfite exporter TauE/SafE family protein [Pirellulales bacterium]
MIEWPMLVISGMLGSAHCLGMCGPFALAIGSAAPGWGVNLRRQLAYSAGRIFTYAVLGATAGFVSTRLARSLPVWTNVPAVLAILAGALLVWQGLLAAGVIRRRGVESTAGCPGGSAFRALLAARGLGDVFLAGLFTGLLPCGLLYGMLAYAASRHDPLQGLAAMAAFGAGTVPAMVAAGLGGSVLSLASRRQVHALAAWCLVATGIVSIARGASFVSLPGKPADGCPFCEATADAPAADPIPAP